MLDSNIDVENDTYLIDIMEIDQEMILEMKKTGRKRIQSECHIRPGEKNPWRLRDRKGNSRKNDSLFNKNAEHVGTAEGKWLHEYGKMEEM